ncbi:MAG: hypothetical protein WBD36_00300 [Bacteroidota bacterium]
MVLHVTNIIPDQRFQCNRKIVSDKTPALQRLGRKGIEDMKQMTVVGTPESDKRKPWFRLIVLDTNPYRLVVRGEFDFSAHLCMNKPLVVVHGGVDKVAEDFFLRPFFAPLFSNLILGKQGEAQLRFVDELIKFIKEGTKHKRAFREQELGSLTHKRYAPDNYGERKNQGNEYRRTSGGHGRNVANRVPLPRRFSGMVPEFLKNSIPGKRKTERRQISLDISTFSQ